MDTALLPKAAEAHAPSPAAMRAVALLAACTLFMESMDGMIVSIALPDMAHYFGTGVIAMNSGITSYLVALAVMLPLSAWIAESWGARRVFVAAVALFTLASLACAASQSLGEFVAARIVQGGSAAMMTPVARLVVLRNTSKERLIDAIALLTWPALVAPAIAPPLGGLIVEHLRWQWIFLINLPFGVGGTVAALLLLPREGANLARTGADWTGLAIWAAAAILVVGGIESAAGLPPLVLSLTVSGGLVASLAAWRHFQRAPRPLLDVRLIARRTCFGTAIADGSAFRSAILANPFLVPLYLRVGLGLPIGRTGLLIMIGMGGNIGMKACTSFILRRMGFRRVLVVNGLLLGASFAAMLLTGPATPAAVLAAILIVTGLARSMQFTTLNTLAFADVATDEMPHANTLFSTAIQLNGAMGVALSALVLEIGYHLFGKGAVAAFHLAFAAIAALSIAAAIACLRHERTLGEALIPAT